MNYESETGLEDVARVNWDAMHAHSSGIERRSQQYDKRQTNVKQ